MLTPVAGLTADALNATQPFPSTARVRSRNAGVDRVHCCPIIGHVAAAGLASGEGRGLAPAPAHLGFQAFDAPLQRVDFSLEVAAAKAFIILQTLTYCRTRRDGGFVGK